MVSLFFIGLVVSLLLTPGPTNTLLASSGIQVGKKIIVKENCYLTSIYSVHYYCKTSSYF